MGSKDIGIGTTPAAVGRGHQHRIHSLGSLLQDLLPVIAFTKLLENSLRNSFVTLPEEQTSRTRASHSNEPPQTVHVTVMQALVLRRSTKKEIKRLIIELAPPGALGKLSGWSQPHFQAYI